MLLPVFAWSGLLDPFKIQGVKCPFCRHGIHMACNTHTHTHIALKCCFRDTLGLSSQCSWSSKWEDEIISTLSLSVCVFLLGTLSGLLSNETSMGKAETLHSPGYVGWGAGCNGLNGSKRLIYVKACATDGGIVWEGLAAMALLEAVSLESAN